MTENLVAPRAGAWIETKIPGMIGEYWESRPARARGLKRYARIGSLLIEQPGVLDYVNLTINGSEDNIPITENQVATVGAVTIGV